MEHVLWRSALLLHVCVAAWAGHWSLALMVHQLGLYRKASTHGACVVAVCTVAACLRCCMGGPLVAGADGASAGAVPERFVRTSLYGLRTTLYGLRTTLYGLRCRCCVRRCMGRPPITDAGRVSTGPPLFMSLQQLEGLHACLPALACRQAESESRCAVPAHHQHRPTPFVGAAARGAGAAGAGPHAAGVCPTRRPHRPVGGAGGAARRSRRRRSGGHAEHRWVGCMVARV